MDRLVTDERLDRAIRDYLVERLDEIAVQGSGPRFVTQRIAGRASHRPMVQLNGLRTVMVGLVLAALASVGLMVAGQQSPSLVPAPPAVVIEAVWPGFRLLSNTEAGVSIQVPETWGRGVRIPAGFALLLQDGKGNAGLNVLTPRADLDLEATVAAILADPGWAWAQPVTRTDLLHGAHRAVRLDSPTGADHPDRGGDIVYLVERAGSRPVVVSLEWDSVADLGYEEEAILRSLNPDGPGPAILASYVDGSSSFVTMTDTGCSAIGPRFAPNEGTTGLTVANQTAHIADFNLLRVGSGYGLLEKDTNTAAEAIATGGEPTWPNASATTWISDRYLQPWSDGRLGAVISPGVYAVMCFPVGEHNESLGVHLTLPFEVVAAQGP
jgi:hypothetical protein